MDISKRYGVLFDDFEEYEHSHPQPESSISSEDLYASLRARQADFKTSSSSFVNIDRKYSSSSKDGDVTYDDDEDYEEDEEAYYLDNWRR